MPFSVKFILESYSKFFLVDSSLLEFCFFRIGECKGTPFIKFILGILIVFFSFPGYKICGGE